METKSLKDFLSTCDLRELTLQRVALLEVQRREQCEDLSDLLDGTLHLLDALSDAAVDCGLVESAQVLTWWEEGWEPFL